MQLAESIEIRISIPLFFKIKKWFVIIFSKANLYDKEAVSDIEQCWKAVTEVWCVIILRKVYCNASQHTSLIDWHIETVAKLLDKASDCINNLLVFISDDDDGRETTLMKSKVSRIYFIIVASRFNILWIMISLEKINLYMYHFLF